MKTKLLDFVLALQESNITSEDLDNRTVEPEVARNLFYINIYGVNGGGKLGQWGGAKVYQQRGHWPA